MRSEQEAKVGLEKKRKVYIREHVDEFTLGLFRLLDESVFQITQINSDFESSDDDERPYFTKKREMKNAQKQEMSSKS